jgi:S1-C subfamily serine protease
VAGERRVLLRDPRDRVPDDAGARADVITCFDGDPIEESRELPGKVAAAPHGSTVPVVVVRAGEE